MEYRFLGRSGMKVSELCLGAMTFARESSTEESNAILDRFVDAGGTFIDTANVYSVGASEELLGNWLKGKDRHRLVVATKVRFPMGEGPNDSGLSRKHIVWQVEESLRRLKSDYIDLYQVHCWDRGTDPEEYLRTLDDLVRSGKVRCIGASNFKGWQLQKAIDHQKRYGLTQFRSLQPQYNLLARGFELELKEVVGNEGLGVIPWSPLKGGWLSGRYRRGMSAPPAGSRVEEAARHGWFERCDLMDKEPTWRVLDALHAVAQESGKHPVQVVLRWLLQQTSVTAPIIGVRTVDHLTTALGAVGWRLEERHVDTLTAASTPEGIYPYDFVEWAQSGR